MAQCSFMHQRQDKIFVVFLHSNKTIFWKNTVIIELRLMSYKYIKMNLILLEKIVTLLLLNTFFIISILQAVFMYLTILFTCRVNNYHFGSLALKSNYIKDNIFSLTLLGKSPTCRVNNYLS